MDTYSYTVEMFETFSFPYYPASTIETTCGSIEYKIYQEGTYTEANNQWNGSPALTIEWDPTH